MKMLTGLVTVLLLWACKPAGSADYHYEIGDGYYLYRTSAHQIGVMSHDGALRIPPKIVELGWDEQFVLAKQQILYGESYQSPVENSFQFWLLDKRDKRLIGPLTEEAFRRERQRLVVPTELKLKSPEPGDK